MRLTACLMWHDEPCEELDAQIRALEGFAHRLVAVDGAWGPPTPKARPFAERHLSPGEQIDTIVRAASEAGLDLTLYQPERHWMGELEHRSYVLSRALEDADWIFLFDSDERVLSWEPDLHDRLASTKFDVGTVKFQTLKGPHKPATKWELPGQVSEQRRLFRANPTLRYDRHHWWLRTDTQALWGTIPGLPFAEAEFMQVHVEHRTCVRTDERWKQKRRYIPVRDRADAARGYEL